MQLHQVIQSFVRRHFFLQQYATRRRAILLQLFVNHQLVMSAMTAPATYNLFLTLTILTSIIIVLILILLLTHFIKRHQKCQPHTNANLENGLPTHQLSRPEIQHQHCDAQQRLSYLTTVAPSIELLPEIRTSSERAEDWLERRDDRTMDGDLGMKRRKETKWNRGADTKNGWGLPSGKGEGAVGEKEKDNGDREDTREDSVVVEKA